MLDSDKLPGHPFTTAHLPDLGISRKQLRAAVEADVVRRVLRGVYVAHDVDDTIAVRAAAARMVIRPGSVVRDRTAAWIHGVDVLGWAETEVLPPVETCVARFNSPTRRGGVDGRTRDLELRDVMTIDDVWVTTPLRTALDLGCNLKRQTALGALDAVMHHHHLVPGQLVAELPRLAGRRGVRQLRSLLPLSDPLRESMRESWMALALHDAGLPMPQAQHWIDIDGVPTWRLDLAYPRHRIVIEYDGEQWHHRTEEQRRHDERRRGWLRAHGWAVIVVTKLELTPTGPSPWIADVREALRQRTTTMRRWVAVR